MKTYCDDGNISHIEEKGLLLGDVEEAILGRLRALMKGGKLIIIDQSAAGQFLTKVLDHVNGESWRPNTAREGDEKERRLARKDRSMRVAG